MKKLDQAILQAVERNEMLRRRVALNVAIEEASIFESLTALNGFDPSQPRDDHGMWTSGGAGDSLERVVSDAKKAHESVAGYSYDESKIREAATTGFKHGDVIQFGPGRTVEVGQGGSLKWKQDGQVKAENNFATLKPEQQHAIRVRHAYSAGMTGYGTGIHVGRP